MSKALFVTAVVVLISGTTVRADNWPQWRGPAGDGVCHEQGVPVSWSESSGVLWKVPLPEWGDSTPAIWNDAIFVTTQADDKLLLLRLSTKDGSTVWSREVGVAETPREAAKRTTQKFHQLHNNASPSPVTDGQVVVAHFGNGDLAVFDFAGKELWRHNLQQDYGTYTIWWGHANSPVLVGDLIINVCMQDSLSGIADQLSPSYLAAHDKWTGRVVWKTMRMTGAEAEQCDSYTTPLLLKRGTNSELVVMGGNQLDAYDPKTGKQLWMLPGLVGGRTITGPTANDQMVFCTAGMRKDLVGVSLGGAGPLPESAVSWRHTENTSDSCSPVLAGKLLFIVTDNGIVQCLNASSGWVLWRERVGRNFKASPVVAEGRVYLQDTQGRTVVIKAAEQFEQLADNHLDDETLASPAISNGRIYLRGRGHLYCIGAK